ncbi:MAG: ATP phosphoribosyltransferase regulatory subunit [Deltaproteobacteria bacterium]|nr:ATP phosphoribosyltransferase regulatory subunit [Deltaproteobacteria bacterium]
MTTPDDPRDENNQHSTRDPRSARSGLNVPALPGLPGPPGSGLSGPSLAGLPDRSGSAVRLPFGVADHLPPEAKALRDHAEAISRVFELYGYDRVITPLFELNDVLDRGLGAAARPSVFRFVDPATGDVVVLRPDFTAQIARLVAAHLVERPRPLRLYYEGRVARAADPLGHGLLTRELFQAGLELIGTSEPWADLEVLSVGLACLGALGHTPTIDLCHAGIVDPLIELSAPNSQRHRKQAREALAVKDPVWLKQVAPALVPLIDLYGEREVLTRARRELRAAPKRVHQAIDELDSLADLLAAKHPSVRLTFDLGEQRNLGYYTGFFFHGYVEGASDAIMVGGRYDHLLEQFQTPEPAVGLAIDMGTLAGRLLHGRPRERSGVVMAEVDLRRPELGEEAARRRAQGERTAIVAADDAQLYARINGFRAICRKTANGALEEVPVTDQTTDIE